MKCFGVSLLIAAVTLFVAHGPMGALMVAEKPIDIFRSEASLFMIWIVPVVLLGLGCSLIFERRASR